MTKSYIIDSISQAHQSMGLPKPKHPLVSIVKTKDYRPVIDFRGLKVVNNLFQVTLKQLGCGNLTYGKNSYDY